MANEKKTNEAIKKVSLDEISLPVTREKFGEKEDGTPLYSYVVKGAVKTDDGVKEIKASFAAKDNGGYELLSLIFAISNIANLTMREESIVDDSGNKSTYVVYEVWNVDKDGILFSYKVKPMRESDKSILKILIQLESLKLASAGKQDK